MPDIGIVIRFLLAGEMSFAVSTGYDCCDKLTPDERAMLKTALLEKSLALVAAWEQPRGAGVADLAERTTGSQNNLISAGLLSGGAYSIW